MFAAQFFVVTLFAASNVLGEEGSPINLDVKQYLTDLTTEVSSLLNNKPVFDTEQFKSLSANIQGAPFHLALSKATVVEIKNVTHYLDDDMQFADAAIKLGMYFSLGESALRFKYVLTETDSRSVTEGNVTIVFSKLKESVKIAVQTGADYKLGTEIVDGHLFFPGTVKSVQASPSISYLEPFTLSIYNEKNNPVDIALEIIDAFELFLKKAIKKVDINKYINNA